MFCKTAIAAIVMGMMLFPYNTYAASWLDTNNYDTSWYVNETVSNYTINTSKEMAGLAYLVNNNSITFDGKVINIGEDIDLTENTWETIKDIFKGTICGAHRIILNCFDGKFIENKDIALVEYSYKVLENNSNLKNINVRKPYTVEILKQVAGATAVFFNNEELSNDKSLLELNLKENDVIDIFNRYYIYIQNLKGLKLPLSMELGDSIDNVKEKYSKKVNIPQEKIILMYNEKELQDCKKRK